MAAGGSGLFSSYYSVAAAVTKKKENLQPANGRRSAGKACIDSAAVALVDKVLLCALEQACKS